MRADQAASALRRACATAALLTAAIAAVPAGALADTPTTAKPPSSTTAPKSTPTPKSASTPAAKSRPGFGAPFRLIAPVQRDVIPVVLGYSSDDDAAAAFGIYDEDQPGVSSGVLTTAGPGGSFGRATTVSGTQQVLSLAYRGDDLELLVGTSPHKKQFGKLLACCSSVEVVKVAPGNRFGQRHTIVPKLNGATSGVLVPVQGRLLAAVATEEGVWAAQSNAGGSFGATHALADGTFNQTIDATGLTNGDSFVAWAARASQFAPGPIAILAARGTPAAGPATPQIAVTVPATHEIDELVVAAHGTVPTVAWVESWTDSAGKPHSRVFSEDLSGAHRAQAISSDSVLASGVALSAAPNGDQVVSYRACAIDGACTIQAALRRQGRFGSPSTLGAIDATQTPAVAEGPTGTPIVGWITPGGDVDAAIGSKNSGRIAKHVTVSRQGYAADLALAFSPAGDRALAVWTAGQLNEAIDGASDTIPVPPVKTPSPSKGKGKGKGKRAKTPPPPQPTEAPPPGSTPS